MEVVQMGVFGTGILIRKGAKKASFLVKYDKIQINVTFLRFFSLKKLHILNICHIFAV